MENQPKDIIALVGAGKGGAAILEMLLQIPNVNIKYVFDRDINAPGIKLAQKHNIQVSIDPDFKPLGCDKGVDLILEVTGNEEIYQKLKSIRCTRCTVIGSAGTRIIFHLLTSLKNANDKLKAYKKGLEYAIIERTEALEKSNLQLENKIRDYERLNEQLHEVNNEKTRYLLQATHQLKAPFAAIQSYTDIILGGYTGEIPERTQDIVHKIKARCDLLSRAIKEMLELANLKSAIRENIKMDEVDLHKVISEVIASFKVIAKNKEIEIQFSPFSESCIVNCSKDQMGILLSVLLENAINYSNDHTKIEIQTLTDEDQMVRLSVKDQGIGIGAENLQKIFNEYFRTNESVAKHPDGTGLGLAIAKQITDLHGFSLEVQSVKNEGATFAIRCPYVRS